MTSSRPEYRGPRLLTAPPDGSRRGKEVLPLVFWLPLLLALMPVQAVALRVLIPGSVRPAEAVAISILDGGVSGEAWLRPATGDPVSRARFFSGSPATAPRTSGSGWSAVLLAVPRGYVGDRILLELAIHIPGTGFRRITRELKVDPREFAHQTIRLSSRLVGVREDDAERRYQEAVELQGILNSANPRAVHASLPFRMPITNVRITGDFGVGRTYLYSDGRRSQTVHNGVDLGGPPGSPILSPGAGRVVYTGFRQVTGLTVVIEHLPGIFSVMMHLDSIAVRSGQLLSRGQVIGGLGASGLATGPHLHWEVRVSGVPVHPLLLTGQSGLRLGPGALTAASAPTILAIRITE